MILQIVNSLLIGTIVVLLLIVIIKKGIRFLPLQRQAPKRDFQDILMRPERLTETYIAPQDELDRLWDILSSECLSSALEEREIEIIRAYIDLLNIAILGLRPATLTPLNVNLVKSQLEELVRVIQRDILTICRTARARRRFTLRVYFKDYGTALEARY